MSRAEKDDGSEALAASAPATSLRVELRRAVPAGMSIFQYVGWLVLAFLCLQIATGLLLMAYYRPSAEAAYESIRIITDEVRLGWLIRFVHYWGTDLLIGLSLIHVIHVYFSRAYQAPRAVNWTVGNVLLVLILVAAFTGTLLPWDQYAYWYTDSARETVSGIPVLGSFLLGVFWGGWEIGDEVLLRFYAFHVGGLPCVILTLVFMHLLWVWRCGIKETARGRTSPAPPPAVLVSDFLMNLLIAVLLAGGILLTVSVLFPPELAEQARALSPLRDAQPRWYLQPVRELLRNLPGGVATVTVFVFFVLLFLAPVLDRRPAQPLWSMLLQRAVGVFVIAAGVFLGVRGYLR